MITHAEPKGVPKLSVCLATFRKQDILDEVLRSIKEKNSNSSLQYEIIVCDDCPDASSLDVVKDNGCYYVWNRNCSNKNPSIPRNCAFRLARGDVIVHQSDDVVHITPNSLTCLSNLVNDNIITFATVYNVHPETREYIETYTGKDRQKPFFFLGAVTRQNIDKIGGYDENFIFPAYDDDDLGDRLIKNGVEPIFIDTVIGFHINHPKGDMGNGVDSSVWYSSQYFKKKRNEIR